MKILQIHKYYSKKIVGGSMTAFFETKNLLEKKGHQVAVFSMQAPDNEPSRYEKYFIKNFDIERAGFWGKIKLIPKTIYNHEAQKNLEKLIQDFQPEVAHVHNVYHYLTPSIFHTLKKHKIPVVFKLSDYKAICPNYKLFTQGNVCERCKGHKYYNCLLHKCMKDSYLASFVGAVEAYAHWLKKSYEKIDLFLAPSQFMKEKCVQFGIPEEKIKILRNVINMEQYQNVPQSEEDNFFLYYGRISAEKGIDNLIKAVSKLKRENGLGGNKLYITGKGPFENELKKKASKLGLKKEVVFTGPKYGDELRELVLKSKFVVLPSIWHDNSPLVVSESQLLGKPVIVSDRGGTREMILDGKSGFVFETENPDDLAGKIEKMLELSADERRKMGEFGKENISQLNNEESYYEKLMQYYNQII